MLRRMGLYTDGQLPRIKQDDWQPVMVMGQLAGLSTEPFEARALVGENLFNAGFAGVSLQAVGGGGLVVESFWVADSGAGVPQSVFVSRTAAAPFVGPTVTLSQVNVGGVNTRAVVRTGGRPAGPPAGSTRVPMPDNWSPISRLVALPGTFLNFFHETAGGRMDFGIQWRELEDVGGGNDAP